MLKALNYTDYDITEVEKKWMEGIEYLRQFHLVDSEHEINKLLKEGKSVLCEGAQGTMLDVDFGSYPFVTSSNTGITCKLKNSYNAGDYTLRLIFKQKNPETGVFFDGWALPYMKGGEANNQIPVYIHDGNAYFHQVSSAINDIEGEGAQVKSVQLYDVEGREILSPKDGQLVIEKQTLYNGKTKTFKRVAH